MSATHLQAPAQYLASQDTHALRQIWATLHEASCPYHYNFHMHTVCSDGQLQPEALIEQAVSIGLKGLAITDHHSVNGYRAAQNWLERVRLEQPHRPFPHLWTGVEINADLLGTEVHLLGYAFNPDYPTLQPYLHGKPSPETDIQAASVIGAIHQAGGLAVLAHPERYTRPATELIPIAAQLGIDGVEAYYAYRNPSPWQTSPEQTQRVKQLSQQYDLFNTCGTDTHGLNLLQRL